MLVEDVRKLMEAALEKLSPAKAQEIARSLMRGQGREQVSKVAQELLEWSQKNRERMTRVVRREVKSQLESLGVASRDELDALKKRVRELERSRGPSAAKKPAAKRASAKRATA